VLAVGDQGFQEKCHQALADFQRAGVSMVLVSHDLGLIQRFCKRAVYLRSGLVAACGDVGEVIAKYTAPHSSVYPSGQGGRQ